jgi:transketolase
LREWSRHLRRLSKVASIEAQRFKTQNASDERARVAIEQASTFGWERYVGLTGRVIGMHTFGASAPLKELQKKFGFEPYEIVAAAKEQIGRQAA